MGRDQNKERVKAFAGFLGNRFLLFLCKRALDVLVRQIGFLKDGPSSFMPGKLFEMTRTAGASPHEIHKRENNFSE